MAVDHEDAADVPRGHRHLLAPIGKAVRDHGRRGSNGVRVQLQRLRAKVEVFGLHLHQREILGGDRGDEFAGVAFAVETQLDGPSRLHDVEVGEQEVQLVVGLRLGRCDEEGRARREAREDGPELGRRDG